MMPLSAKQNKAYPTVAMAYYYMEGSTFCPFLHKQTNKKAKCGFTKNAHKPKNE
jgi:hypothetical protein